MTTTAQALPGQQARITQHAHSMLTILAWEAHRLRAGRLTWISAFLAFGCFSLVIWGTQTGGGTYAAENGGTFSYTTPKTSVNGLLEALLPSLLILFGLLLPFVNADGVARDLKRRTHELMMTTPIATWAYVWGRYLSCLLTSLGLALLMLAAILLDGLSEHMQHATLPLPQIGPTVASWAALVLPLTVLLSSVSFALGTWLPRRTTLLKSGVMAVWYIGSVLLSKSGEASAQPSWNPITIDTSSLLYNQGIDISTVAQKATSNDVFQQAVNIQQNQLPDLGPWLVPHLFWAALGLALVLLVAASFKRFRNNTN